mmetsp:Transcript_30993/g.75809  ORF Transcript_30993/g.75809 Transcript_30993/m.75809 type:complete len:203 (+) Transcript_30993:549-1157(+)
MTRVAVPYTCTSRLPPHAAWYWYSPRAASKRNGSSAATLGVVGSSSGHSVALPCSASVLASSAYSTPCCAATTTRLVSPAAALTAPAWRASCAERSTALVSYDIVSTSVPASLSPATPLTTAVKLSLRGTTCCTMPPRTSSARPAPACAPSSLSTAPVAASKRTRCMMYVCGRRSSPNTIAPRSAPSAGSASGTASTGGAWK